jgi:hypothetical protein
MIAMLGCAALLAPAAAEAQSFHVRSFTVGSATHFVRSDRSIAAPRPITQALSLRGHDLLGDRSGSLNMTLAMHYTSDLGLNPGLRNDPARGAATLWNRPALDLMYLEWRPLASMTLRLGRHWSYSALGVRDFDGLTARIAPELGSLRPYLELGGGREVQLGFAPLAPFTFDVQGLPALAPDRLDGAASWRLVARAGLRWRRSTYLDITYQHRWTVGLDHSAGGPLRAEERLGAATSTTLGPRVVLSAHAAYHLLLEDLDRGQLQLVWATPLAGSALTVGLERRRPWFDSDSIFNLFGARPHQDAYLIAEIPLVPRLHEVELRLWYRAFHGDARLLDLGTGPTDARALGCALGYRARIDALGRRFDWRTRLSFQQNTNDYGGSQMLADTRLRAPLLANAVFGSARLIYLRALPDHHRYETGHAGSALLGAEVPVLDGRATFGAFLEHRASTYFRPTTHLYGAFEMEVWP